MDIIYLPEIHQTQRDTITPLLHEWKNEVNKLLGDSANPKKVVFNNYFLIPETGTGGFADDENVLVLAFDPNFHDIDQQLQSLKASYFHESYHIAQGWLGDTVLPPLQESILEGAATVFERSRAHGKPPWGEYESGEAMRRLFDQVSQLGPDYDHEKWKYFDKESGEKWILYKVGTFVVDEALRKNPNLTIEILADKKYKEIIEHSRL